MTTWNEHFRERGMAVPPPFNAERAAVLGVTEDEPEAEPMKSEESAEDTEDQRPAKNAVKAEWVDFAVAHGMERAEAEDMTKDALIEQFGG